MPVYSDDVIGATNAGYAVRTTASPQTDIVKDDVLVYLYSDASSAAAVNGYAFDRATLINYGHVVGDGGAVGAIFGGVNATVRNAAGADISGDGGVVFSGSYSTLINEGSISGVGFGATLGDGGTLRNSGRIDGYIFGSSNTGITDILNTGVISGSGSLAISINIDQSAPGFAVSIKNAGEIFGDVQIISQSSSGSAVTLVNSGLLSGDLRLSNDRDSVDNRGGHITGDVLLGGGSNTFDNRGGRVDGSVIGGADDDVYTIDATPLSIVEYAGAGFDTIQASTISLSLDLYSNIENLTLLGGLNLNLTGDEGANILTGNVGRNTLTGGLGDDAYYVQNAGDKVIEGAAGGVDTVYTTVSFTLTAGQQIETLSVNSILLSANVNLGGNEFANTLNGNGGENILNGGGGADTMNGFGGADAYYVDNAGDRVFEAAGGGADTVYASVTYTLAAGQEIERLLAADTAATTAIALTGNEIGNTMRGNAGANVIAGRLGADFLTGLGGADTFKFDTALGSGNVDRITDFSVVDDTIGLARSVFTALPVGVLAADAFKDLGVAGASVDASDRILYNRTSGALFYDADGDGATAAIRFATLDNRALVTEADFLVS